MRLNLARARTLVLDLPRQAKLTYCLLRDPRIPAPPKLALGGGLAIVLSPIDLPDWMPVLGELDTLALGILGLKVFVSACPEAIVAEHRAAIGRGESLFDRDLRGLAAAARSGGQSLAEVAMRRRGASMPAAALEEMA